MDWRLDSALLKVNDGSELFEWHSNLGSQEETTILEFSKYNLKLTGSEYPIWKENHGDSARRLPDLESEANC